MIETNGFDKSVNKCRNTLPFSNAGFHFSSKAKRYRWILYPFLKPYWYFENISSNYADIWLRNNSSKHLDRVGKMLTDLLLSFLPFFFFFRFLRKVVTSVHLRHKRSVQDLTELFMLFHKNSAQISTFSFRILVGIF